VALADVYAMHLLDPARARRFLAKLRHAPERPALEAVGRGQRRREPGVFLARVGDRRPLSLAEVYAALRSGVEEQRTARGSLVGGPAAPSAARTGHRDAGRPGPDGHPLRVTPPAPPGTAAPG
jgi:hypothetical protein